MKKKLLLVLLVFASILVLASCKKDCKHESVSFYRTVKEPTCISVGKDQYVCDDCGEYFTYDIEKIEHVEDIGTVTIEPTCYSEGQKTFRCVREECNEILRVEKIDMIPHKEGEGTVTTPATCTSEGEMSYFCTNKGCTLILRTEVIEILDHTEGDWQIIVHETCSEDGYKALLCADCDYEFERESITAHHVEQIMAEKDSTCSATGLTEGVKCSVCNEVLVAQEIIPVKPHTLVDVPSIDPTCTSYGYTAGVKCSNCDYWSIEQDQIPMLDHTVVTDDAVSATCITTGLTEGSHCSVCNTTIVSQTTTSALGHNFDFYNNTCNRCSAKEYQEVRSTSEFQAYENANYNAVIYLDYIDSAVWILTIGPETEHIKFVGTEGREYRVHLVLNSSRTKDLKIDLINVTLKGGCSRPLIESQSSANLTLGLYGTSNIIGNTGSAGANSSVGNGGAGGNGTIAISISGNLTINMGANYAEIRGGNGGKGGNGGFSTFVGMSGGNGGNGASAIRANSITVVGVNGKSSRTLTIVGGSGGAGGNGGAGIVTGSKGSSGSSASSATNVAVTYN